MTKMNDQMLGVLLDAAEQQHACLRADNAHVLRLLRQRVSNDSLLEPVPFLFIRKSCWAMLKPDEQHRYLLRAYRDNSNLIFAQVSAATVYHLAVSYNLLDAIHVAVPRNNHSRTRRSGIFVNHHLVDPPICIENIAVTAPLQTVFDCIRSLEFRDAVAIADTAMHDGLFTKEVLNEYVKAKKGWTGARRARTVAKFADGRAESGGESIARAVMYELGFIVPDLQVEFHDPLNDNVSRVDFLWTLSDGSKIAGELDGMEKYTNPSMTDEHDIVEILSEERRRESRLTIHGLKIARFSFHEVLDTRYFARLLESFGVPKCNRRRA